MAVIPNIKMSYLNNETQQQLPHLHPHRIDEQGTKDAPHWKATLLPGQRQCTAIRRPLHLTYSSTNINSICIWKQVISNSFPVYKLVFTAGLEVFFTRKLLTIFINVSYLMLCKKNWYFTKNWKHPPISIKITITIKITIISNVTG